VPDPAVKPAQALLKRAKVMREVHRRKKGDDLKKSETDGDKERIASYHQREEESFKRIVVRPLDELVAKAESTERPQASP